ncbi:RES family NAD+ phosphorylase [Rhizobium sp. ICMP 5592]|uniref:RES family NAD+ phosphorylase n=1 Tax=Rhizobium sp. ICMP 5592 TaxID=2292445 RepID=UPI00129608E7|nr:RES family NAD+ phosphorylase [Rhizobium sp. ICMP 5592]MQB43035.1 RES domain-containing protein [Rhizobium sp. ICMP 5592]
MSTLSRQAVRQEITKLNRLDPKRAWYSAIEATYQRLTNGLSIVVGTAGGGELFYRVRKTGGEKPRFISELQAPPAKYVTGFQRCNPPGVPMFYAASRRIGALIESRVTVGETVYLSEWIGRDNIPVNRIFDGEYQSTLSGDNDDLIITYLDTQFTRRIHETFADDYKFTAAIAQQLTSKFEPGHHNIAEDGYVALKYPSVLDLELSHNTAMPASFAAERLDLLHVMELRVISSCATDVVVEVTDTAVRFDDGSLQWTSNPNLVPALLNDNRSVPFVWDGMRWNRSLHDGAITPAYIQSLMAN